MGETTIGKVSGYTIKKAAWGALSGRAGEAL
jgi:hypothetical protein